MQKHEQNRWQQTLKALESVEADKVVDSHDVHLWLNSWGTKNELNPPKIDD